MEQAVERSGAQTPDEIRAAVKEGWKLITPAYCVKMSSHVRKNMLEVIRLKGGNFYKD